MADQELKRKAFKEYYCDPTSETWGKVRLSAIKAGFSESYAKVLMSDSTGNEWVKEIIKDSKLLNKAEKNLGEFLDADIEEPVISMFGPVIDKETQEPYRKRNPKVMSIKADVSKFVAKTLGKHKYSERSELTGPDG